MMGLNHFNPLAAIQMQTNHGRGAGAGKLFLRLSKSYSNTHVQSFRLSPPITNQSTNKQPTKRA